MKNAQPRGSSRSRELTGRDFIPRPARPTGWRLPSPANSKACRRELAGSSRELDSRCTNHVGNGHRPEGHHDC